MLFGGKHLGDRETCFLHWHLLSMAICKTGGCHSPIPLLDLGTSIPGPSSMKILVAVSILSLASSQVSCAQQKQKAGTQSEAASRDVVILERQHEPRERALSLLVPRGWTIEGGALRILNPEVAGVSNMVDCKFDMAIKRDAAGSVMIRWLPEMLCVDLSMAFGNPEGAVFNNCLVRRKRSPKSFVLEVAIPYAHPNATDVKVVGGKELPSLAARYSRSVDPMLAGVTNMSYRAGLLDYTYREKGVKYQERMVAVIEDYGANAGGMWKNRETMLIRAPEGQLEKWEPMLCTIQNSGKWNRKWIAGEINGQRKRAGQILVTQQELNAIDNAITEQRRNTYSEINKDMYLTLTSQNEYKNPHTGEVEVDTDKWKHRWINSIGDLIYTDDDNYNPNHDPYLNKTGFERSMPRR